jgi:hypothetical protein
MPLQRVLGVSAASLRSHSLVAWPIIRQLLPIFRQFLIQI